MIEGEPSSPASDVHSWGSTMAFAATGHLPFGGGSYETIFYRIISGRADLSGVPAPLVPLISAALARDPSHRPSAGWLSAQAVALDMSATTPAYDAFLITETQYPREAVSILRGAVGRPPGSAGAQAGGQGRRGPAAAGQLPAGRSSRNSSRTRTRPARGARRVPSPPFPRPRLPRVPPPGRTPRPASPSWSRWWR